MTDAAMNYTTLSLPELLAMETPEMEWVVDGILPLGSFTMLAAREKSGKSLLGIDLCCSVALGEPFLDRAVRRGPVLLVPAEDNIRDVRTRLLARLNGRVDADIHTLVANGFDGNDLRLDKADSIARLAATIDAVQPILIVLDPMRELHDLPENDADVMAPLLRPLREVAHYYNIAILMNHHMSRAGTSRGSTAIRAAVDQEWAFRRKDDDAEWDSAPAEGTIRIEGRFGRKQMIGVTFVPETARWASGPVLIDESGSQNRVIDLLRNHPDGLSAETIASSLGVAQKTIQNTISVMLRDPAPLIVAVGRGVTGDPRRYSAIDPFLTIPDVPDGNTGNTGNSHKVFPTVPEDRGPGTPGTVLNGKSVSMTCAGCGRYLDATRPSCPFCGSVAVRI